MQFKELSCLIHCKKFTEELIKKARKTCIEFPLFNCISERDTNIQKQLCNIWTKDRRLIVILFPSDIVTEQKLKPIAKINDFVANILNIPIVFVLKTKPVSFQTWYEFRHRIDSTEQINSKRILNCTVHFVHSNSFLIDFELFWSEPMYNSIQFHSNNFAFCMHAQMNFICIQWSATKHSFRAQTMDE